MPNDEVKPDAASKKPAVRKYTAIKKFGYSGGQANVGDVVKLTSPEAKLMNKSKAIAPFIEDDEGDN